MSIKRRYHKKYAQRRAHTTYVTCHVQAHTTYITCHVQAHTTYVTCHVQAHTTYATYHVQVTSYAGVSITLHLHK